MKHYLDGEWHSLWAVEARKENQDVEGYKREFLHSDYDGYPIKVRWVKINAPV